MVVQPLCFRTPCLCDLVELLVSCAAEAAAIWDVFMSLNMNKEWIVGNYKLRCATVPHDVQLE